MMLLQKKKLNIMNQTVTSEKRENVVTAIKLVIVNLSVLAKLNLFIKTNTQGPKCWVQMWVIKVSHYLWMGGMLDL